MKINTLAWWMWDFVQYFLNLSFQYIFIGFQDPMTVYTRNFNWGKIGAQGEKTIAIKKELWMTNSKCVWIPAAFA